MGESVLAYDFKRGTWVERRVESRHENIYEGPVLTLTTDSGTLRTTAYHPFWVERGHDLGERNVPRELSPIEDQGYSLEGKWVNSHELRVGDLLVGRGGSRRALLRIEQEYKSAFPVNNLMIEKDHTYAVGPDGLLAHNLSLCEVLRNFHSKYFYINGKNILLDKAGMKHILERHHPDYWDGSIKATQTFFSRHMSPEEIAEAVKEVLKQNRERIGRMSANAMGQVEGVYKGVKYTLGLNKGRVGQFFPSDVK